MAQPAPETGFDEEALSELQEDLGEAMPDFVAGFLSSLDTTLQSMRVSLAAARPDAVGESAHGLKGTAGYLGAVELVSTLSEIQQRCNSGGSTRAIERLLDRADVLAQRARRRLEALCES